MHGLIQLKSVFYYSIINNIFIIYTAACPQEKNSNEHLCTIEYIYTSYANSLKLVSKAMQNIRYLCRKR